MFFAKIKATFFHGLVTLSIAAICGYVVFFIWYPDKLAEIAAGADLYILVLIGEITLGPLLTFVIFNANKSVKELVVDYCLIGLVQLSALGYGLYSVALSRPVYLVFVKDRIEVVAATELSTSDLADAGLSPSTLPWWGPEFVCTESPDDFAERSELLMSALKGRDIQLIPKYYRECGATEVADGMYDYTLLKQVQGFEESFASASIDEAAAGWLPVVTRFGAWLAVYPEKQVDNPIYLNLNPFVH